MRSLPKAGIVLAACCLAANADLFNHKIVLVGDKGAALGGAYSGLADDATATYYNPAGLTQIKNIKLNVSAQVVQYQKQKIGIAQGVDIPYNSFNFSPTITAFSQRMGNWAYGFSVVTPINDLFTGEQKIEGAYRDETSDTTAGCYAAPGDPAPCFTRLNLSYYDVAKSTMIGPSLALKYNDRISLGFTLYAIYNTELEKTAYGGWDANYVEGDTEDLSRFHESNVTRSVTQTGLGLSGMFGALVQLSQGFSVGVNLSPGSMVWVSRVEEQRVEEISNDTVVSARDPVTGTRAIAIYNLNGTEKHTEVAGPSLSLAVSWKPIDRLLLTAQTDYYLGSQYSYTGYTPDDTTAKGRSGFEALTPLQKTYTIKKNDVVDFSGGIEVEVLKGYTLALGGYTDFSQGPDDNRPASWDRNIDYYGFTASLGMDKDLTQSRFGFGMAYGDAAITHFQWTKKPGGQPVLMSDRKGVMRIRQNFDAYNVGIFISSTLKI
jgi:long-subunit fatty acid transport protein